MLRYANVPHETMFVIVTETQNPQEPFIKARGGLYQYMELLTESNLIKYLPVPQDVAAEIEKRNPEVVCIHMKVEGPIGNRTPETRYFLGGDNDVRIRRSLRPLLAGIPEAGEYMR